MVAAPGNRLWDALSPVPDHRWAAGQRYPLASLLLIAVAAMLAGRPDQLGIVCWGRRLSRETLSLIGIHRARVPAPSVWCELFQDLDVTALERGLGGWVSGAAPVAGHVATAGKRLRCSATAQSPGTHLLAAFSAGLQGVIGPLRQCAYGYRVGRQGRPGDIHDPHTEQVCVNPIRTLGDLQTVVSRPAEQLESLKARRALRLQLKRQLTN